MTHTSPTLERRTSAPNELHQKSGTSTFSLSATLPLLVRDYRAAARQCRIAFRDADSSLTWVCYTIACLAYRLAKLLRDDDTLWKEFQDDPFFAGHSRLDRHHCLRYALMYMYGDHQGRHAERARDHARALLPLWEKKASTQEVSTALREGGFKKLKEMRQKRTTVSDGGGACVLRQTFQIKNNGINRKLKRFRDGDDVVAYLKARKSSRGHMIFEVTKVALRDRCVSNSTASRSKRRGRRSARRTPSCSRGRRERFLTSSR